MLEIVFINAALIPTIIVSGTAFILRDSFRLSRRSRIIALVVLTLAVCVQAVLEPWHVAVIMILIAVVISIVHSVKLKLDDKHSSKTDNEPTQV